MLADLDIAPGDLAAHVSLVVVPSHAVGEAARVGGDHTQAVEGPALGCRHGGVDAWVRGPLAHPHRPL